jgi:cell division control protein 24
MGHPTASPMISMDSSKRGSGSSQSTGDNSEYSPHTASPLFGSSEHALVGSALCNGSPRSSGVQYGSSDMVMLPNLMIAKVFLLECIFVIQPDSSAVRNGI